MELREETIESIEAYSGKLLKLRIDKVRLPNGVETTRETVVHNGAVAIVPITNDNRILMVRQFRHASGEILLEIPAGTLEAGEEPIECAARELHEEAGYKADDLKLMFSSYLAPGYSTELLHMFIARKMMYVGEDREPDEFMEVVEVPIDHAIELIKLGEIRDSKSISGILMALYTMGH